MVNILCVFILNKMSSLFFILFYLERVSVRAGFQFNKAQTTPESGVAVDHRLYAHTFACKLYKN